MDLPCKFWGVFPRRAKSASRDSSKRHAVCGCLEREREIESLARPSVGGISMGVEAFSRVVPCSQWGACLEITIYRHASGHASNLIGSGPNQLNRQKLVVVFNLCVAMLLMLKPWEMPS